MTHHSIAHHHHTITPHHHTIAHHHIITPSHHRTPSHHHTITPSHRTPSHNITSLIIIDDWACEEERKAAAQTPTRTVTIDMDEEEYEERRAASSIFRQVLAQESSRQRYREFLTSEFAVENLDFYVASEDLRKLSDEAAVRRAFEDLFTRFISKAASTQSINISDNLYNKLNKLNAAWGATRIEEIVDLVSVAQSEIANMLEFDSFPRFVSRSPSDDSLASLG
jgi:hypothetical protein